MFSESLLYAMILGPLALAPITGELKFGGFSPHLDDFPLKLVVAAGAGFYEEAFFRFVILGAMFYLAKEVGKLRPFAAGALALVLSGAFFSAAHFLAGGETPDLGTFIYRLAAGMILGLVFLTRGFGIAAWTHAIYDLYLLCFAGRMSLAPGRAATHRPRPRSRPRPRIPVRNGRGRATTRTRTPRCSIRHDLEHVVVLARGRLWS